MLKSIGQFFKTNQALLNEPEVQGLIEYSRELEGKVLENNLDEKFDKEQLMLEWLREMHRDCVRLLKEDEESLRFKETPRVDFKQSVINLMTYIKTQFRDNNLKL